MTTRLTLGEVAEMIDVSAVQANSTQQDFENAVKLADEFSCIAIFGLGQTTFAHFPQLRQMNERRAEAGLSQIRIGGVVGFPDGGAMTAVKQFEAKQLYQLGCDEIDMVMNVGQALSGNWDVVKEDIQAVKSAIGSRPMKVILECAYLTDEQITQAAQTAMEAGAAWVKSGTGWTEKKTTVHTIEVMKAAVGDRCRVKAAGGVRDLQTLLDMHAAGAERFGIGVRTARAIFEQLQKNS